MAGTKSYGYLRDTNKDFHVLVHRLAHRHVILSGGGTTTLVEGDSGALCVFDVAAASQFTLPAPTLGMYFEFVATIDPSADHVIASSTDDEGFLGGVGTFSTTVAEGGDWFAAATDGNNDNITLDGDTLGGKEGTYIMVTAILNATAAKAWVVTGYTGGVGTLATPFGDAQL